MSARRNSQGLEAPAYGRLKLRARDAEDLQAIAMCLQDALVPLSDMAFLKAEKRFVLVANRFRWERPPVAPNAGLPDGDETRESDARYEDGDEVPAVPYERVNCGVCFDGVRAVRFRGLDPKERQNILNLLTIEGEAGAITLIFSAGAEIRLEVERVRCHLEDLGEPWPTLWRPAHDETAEDGAADQESGLVESERR